MIKQSKMQRIIREQKWLRKAKRLGLITDEELLSRINKIRGELGFEPFKELPIILRYGW